MASIAATTSATTSVDVATRAQEVKSSLPSRPRNACDFYRDVWMATTDFKGNKIDGSSAAWNEFKGRVSAGDAEAVALFKTYEDRAKQDKQDKDDQRAKLVAEHGEEVVAEAERLRNKERVAGNKRGREAEPKPIDLRVLVDKSIDLNKSVVESQRAIYSDETIAAKFANVDAPARDELIAIERENSAAYREYLRSVIGVNRATRAYLVKAPAPAVNNLVEEPALKKARVAKSKAAVAEQAAAPMAVDGEKVKKVRKPAVKKIAAAAASEPVVTDASA